MLRHMLLSKIHRATVTAADLNYEGSITIDATLMEAANILPYERVQVLNINNGSRAETYAIKGEKDSGDIVMNGAIARIAQVGDLVLILSYGMVEEAQAKKKKATIVHVDQNNKIVRIDK
jgi:aspartate 1-decarboxylase